MSERLERRAEVLKLARLLSIDEADLDFLEDVPAADLRELRSRATDRLFASAPGLLRVAAAAKLIPSGLVATISQRAFGPMLVARAAGGADTAKAIDVAKRLPADFLADATIHLDPRRVAAIIAEVPRELVVPVAQELGRREEHVTMGRFLAFVPDHAIAAAMGVLSDEVMLRTAFVLEHKDRLDHAIGLLPPDRVPGILRRASEVGLWPEALDLLEHISEERRGPLADVVATLEPEVVESLVAAVSEADVWESLLPVVRVMSEESRLRIVAQPVFHTPAVLGEILDVATAQGLWLDLVPLVDALPHEAHQVLAGLVTALDSGRLAGLVAEAVVVPESVVTMLGIVHDMDESGRALVIDAIDQVERSVGEALLAAMTDPALIQRLVALVTPDVMAAIERAAERVGMTDELQAALRLAR